MIKPRIDLLVSSSCNGCNSLIISKISFSSPSTTNEKISKSLETQSLFKLPKSSKNTFYWNLFYHRKKIKLRKFLKINLLLFIIPQFGGSLMKLFVRHATSSHMLNPCSPTKGLQFQKPSNYKQKLALGRSRTQWSNKALHHLSPLQSVCHNAPRQHVQKDKKKKKEKNTYEKTNNNKHHQLEEQLTMSTSRNLEKFSTPENWRVFVARVRKQTGANAGNGPLLLENVTLIHPIKGRR